MDKLGMVSVKGDLYPPMMLKYPYSFRMVSANYILLMIKFLSFINLLISC